LRLNDTEAKNLRHYGYGIKSFILSMSETAIELTESRVDGTAIAQLLSHAKEMVETPVELLPNVHTTIETLSRSHDLMIITKGDLFDQESKIARSGLGDFFVDVQVVTDKTRAAYGTITSKYGLRPEEFLMVGNSLRSDILPVLDLGAHAIHVPYETTWEHEAVGDRALADYRFPSVPNIRDVPPVVARIDAAPRP
jgi:putative hydrolase of the HAD superfamily